MDSAEKQESTSTQVQQDIDHFKEQYLHSLGLSFQRPSLSSPSSLLSTSSPMLFGRRDSLSGFGTRRNSLSSSSSMKDSSNSSVRIPQEDALSRANTRHEPQPSCYARVPKVRTTDPSVAPSSNETLVTDRDRIKNEYIKSLGLSHRHPRPKGLPCLKDRVSEFETLMTTSKDSVPKEIENSKNHRLLNFNQKYSLTSSNPDQNLHRKSKHNISVDKTRSTTNKDIGIDREQFLNRMNRQCRSSWTFNSKDSTAASTICGTFNNQPDIPATSDCFHVSSPNNGHYFTDHQPPDTFSTHLSLSPVSMQDVENNLHHETGVSAQGARVERAFCLGSKREFFEKLSQNSVSMCDATKHKLTDLAHEQHVIHKTYSDKEKAFILESFRKAGGRQQRTLSLCSSMGLADVSDDGAGNASLLSEQPSRSKHSVNIIVDRFENISHAKLEDTIIHAPPENNLKSRAKNYDKQVHLVQVLPDTSENCLQALLSNQTASSTDFNPKTEEETIRERMFECVLHPVQEKDKTGRIVVDKTIPGKLFTNDHDNDEEDAPIGEVVSESDLTAETENRSEMSRDEGTADSSLPEHLNNSLGDKSDKVWQEDNLNKIRHSHEGSRSTLPTVSKNLEVAIGDLRKYQYVTSVFGEIKDLPCPDETRENQVTDCKMPENECTQIIISKEAINSEMSTLNTNKISNEICEFDYENKKLTNADFSALRPDSLVFKRVHNFSDAACENINEITPQSFMNVGVCNDIKDAKYNNLEIYNTNLLVPSSFLGNKQEVDYYSHLALGDFFNYLPSHLPAYQTQDSSENVSKQNKIEKSSRNSVCIENELAINSLESKHEIGNLDKRINKLSKNVEGNGPWHTLSCLSSCAPTQDIDKGEQVSDKEGNIRALDKGNNENKINSDSGNAQRTSDPGLVFLGVRDNKHEGWNIFDENLYDDMFKRKSVDESCNGIVLFDSKYYKQHEPSLSKRDDNCGFPIDNNGSFLKELEGREAIVSKEDLQIAETETNWSGVKGLGFEIQGKLINDSKNIMNKDSEGPSNFFNTHIRNLPCITGYDNYNREHMANINTLIHEDKAANAFNDISLTSEEGGVPKRNACNSVEVVHISTCSLHPEGCSGEPIKTDDGSCKGSFMDKKFSSCGIDSKSSCNLGSEQQKSSSAGKTLVSDFLNTLVCFEKNPEIFSQLSECRFTHGIGTQVHERCSEELNSVGSCCKNTIEAYVASIVDSALRDYTSESYVFSKRNAKIIDQVDACYQNTCFSVPESSCEINPEVDLSLQVQDECNKHSPDEVNIDLLRIDVVRTKHEPAAEAVVATVSESFGSDHINGNIFDSELSHPIQTSEFIGNKVVEKETSLICSDEPENDLLGSTSAKLGITVYNNSELGIGNSSNFASDLDSFINDNCLLACTDSLHGGVINVDNVLSTSLPAVDISGQKECVLNGPMFSILDKYILEDNFKNTQVSALGNKEFDNKLDNVSALDNKEYYNGLDNIPSLDSKEFDNIPDNIVKVLENTRFENDELKDTVLDLENTVSEKRLLHSNLQVLNNFVSEDHLLYKNERELDSTVLEECLLYSNIQDSNVSEDFLLSSNIPDLDSTISGYYLLDSSVQKLDTRVLKDSLTENGITESDRIMSYENFLVTETSEVLQRSSSELFCNRGSISDMSESVDSFYSGISDVTGSFHSADDKDVFADIMKESTDCVDSAESEVSGKHDMNENYDNRGRFTNNVSSHCENNQFTNNISSDTENDHSIHVNNHILEGITKISYLPEVSSCAGIVCKDGGGDTAISGSTYPENNDFIERFSHDVDAPVALMKETGNSINKLSSQDLEGFNASDNFVDGKESVDLIIYDSVTKVGVAIHDNVTNVDVAIYDNVKNVGSMINDNVTNVYSTINDNVTNVGVAIHDNVKNVDSTINDNVTNVDSIIHDNVINVGYVIHDNVTNVDSIANDNVTNVDSIIHDNVTNVDSIANDNVTNVDSIIHDNVINVGSVIHDNVTNVDSIRNDNVTNVDSIIHDNVINVGSVIHDNVTNVDSIRNDNVTNVDSITNDNVTNVDSITNDINVDGKMKLIPNENKIVNAKENVDSILNDIVIIHNKNMDLIVTKKDVVDVKEHVEIFHQACSDTNTVRDFGDNVQVCNANSTEFFNKSLIKESTDLCTSFPNTANTGEETTFRGDLTSGYRREVEENERGTTLAVSCECRLISNVSSLASEVQKCETVESCTHFVEETSTDTLHEHNSDCQQEQDPKAHDQELMICEDVDNQRFELELVIQESRSLLVDTQQGDFFLQTSKHFGEDLSTASVLEDDFVEKTNCSHFTENVTNPVFLENFNSVCKENRCCVNNPNSEVSDIADEIESSKTTSTCVLHSKGNDVLKGCDKHPVVSCQFGGELSVNGDEMVANDAYTQLIHDNSYDSNTESIDEGAESMDKDSLDENNDSNMEDHFSEDVGHTTTINKISTSEQPSTSALPHLSEAQNDFSSLSSLPFVPEEDEELTEDTFVDPRTPTPVKVTNKTHTKFIERDPCHKTIQNSSDPIRQLPKIKVKRWKEAEDAASTSKGNSNIRSPRKTTAPVHLDLASLDMTEVADGDMDERTESPGAHFHRISSGDVFKSTLKDGSRLDSYRFLERSQSDASLLKRDLEILATDDDVHLTAAESSSGQNISECNRVYLDLSRAEAFERVELGESSGAMMRTSSGRLLETIPQDEELKTGDLSYVYASHRSFSQESSSSLEDLTFSPKGKGKDNAKYKSGSKTGQDGSITSSKSNLRSSFQIYSHSLKQKVRQLQMGSVPEQLNALTELNVLMEQAWSMPIYGKDLAYELCDILRTESALDIIVSNLASNNRELLKVSARLLEQSLTTSNRRQVAENGLELVVKMTRDARGDCELAQICTGILESLFKTSEDTCSKVIKLGGLDTITYWCRCNDRVTLKNCAIALSNLALYGGGENQQEMAKHKVPEWLFPLAFVEDDSVRYYALLAIGVMVSNKEIENAVTSSGTLALVLPFIESHDPAEFAERDTSHRHGRSPGWLKRLIPVLSSRREEAQALAAFHFVMEAGIKSEQGRKEVLYKIGAVDPLKWLASTPNRVASKLAAQALKIIGEEVPHKLSQQVPLWTCDDVVHWIAQVGFGIYADKFKSCHFDGDLLLRLTEEELRDSLSMSCAITRKRFLRELRDLKISSDYTSCDPSMLGAWLQEVGEDMSQYTYQMLHQGVDKPLLRSLTDSHLVNDCKIVNGIHRMKILSKIEELRSSMTSPSCPRLDNIDGMSIRHSSPRTPIDVFISYRRSNGSQLASLLKVHLQLRGFTVFIDIEKLRAGKFDESLLESVRQAKNFIIVLTQNSLDRCMGDDERKDWVHREITAAIEAGSNIIPLLDNFKWPSPETLPDDMRSICYFNAVRWIHDYQDACVDKLEQFLRGETNQQHQPPTSITNNVSAATSSPKQTSSAFESQNSPPYQRAQGIRKMSSIESPVDSS